MSTYEKIATIGISILLIGMILFSFHEFTEPKNTDAPTRNISQFEASRGKDFIMGPYTKTVSEASSSEIETNCEPWKPVIIAALHDIKEHLEHDTAKNPSGSEYPFEVSEPVLDLFCHQTSDITLANQNGEKLLLKKYAFKRMIPEHGTALDIGSLVRIDAWLISASTTNLGTPTTYGSVLIPDRYLGIGDTTPE